ncbi:hypothetical protein B9G55_05795 [Saccharibacillus sp. O16]|nr:hypothetical protein B9G55_05795 [Saccharibacillus sp. O16]
MALKKASLLSLAVLLSLTSGQAAVSAAQENSQVTSSDVLSINDVQVKNPEQMQLDKQELNALVDRAAGVAEDERAQYLSESPAARSLAPQQVIINYSFADEENDYFYQDTGREQSLIVTPASQTNEETAPDAVQEAPAVEEAAPEQAFAAAAAEDKIPGGIGARAVINSSSGNLLESKWQLPTDSEVAGDSNSVYVYTGLRGSAAEVDANVSYNTNGEKKWKPRLCFKTNAKGAKCVEGVAQSGYNQVQSSNGFAPGAVLQTAFWKSFNDPSRGISNAIRLKLTGKAICTTMGCSDSADKTLIHILEVNNKSKQLGTLQYFKLLGTLADLKDANGNVKKKASGKLKTKFTDIKLDKKAVNFNSNSLITDHAKASYSGNSVTVDVNSAYPQ